MGAAMNEKWSWKDLPAFMPVIASSFAFAFVVGYFYAFDIAWFAFFSFPEHLVFALRALPIAMGASVGFLIALRFSDPESQWSWFKKKSHWFVYGWMCVLAAAAFVAIMFGNHLGLAVSFVLIATGAYVYKNVPGDIPGSRAPLATTLNWAITLMVLCFMVGFLSGNSWRIDWFSQHGHAMAIVTAPAPGDAKPSAGHVIYAGSSGVLFYNFVFRQVQFIRRDAI